MSRNSKNARNTARAKQFSAIRKSGGRSPARTIKVNGKRNTWWTKKRAAQEVNENEVQAKKQRGKKQISNTEESSSQ